MDFLDSTRYQLVLLYPEIHRMVLRHWFAGHETHHGKGLSMSMNGVKGQGRHGGPRELDNLERE